MVRIRERAAELSEALQQVSELQNVIDEISAMIADTLAQGGKLLLCGNGGSAAEAQHIATEYVVRLSSDFNRKALPAIALTTDTSLLTAAANDLGFERIFSRQVEALANDGDILMGLSTSGNSPNVIEAVNTARSRNAGVICITGPSGGKLDPLSDICFKIPAKNTQNIQEVSLFIQHIIVENVEQVLFG